MAKRASYLKMSVDALLRLRDEITDAVTERIASERKSLESRLAALSNYVGTSKRQTPVRRKKRSGGQHPLKGRQVAAKYRGPKGETWSGRGLPPRWLTALEKKGKKRERYLVSRS